MANPPVEASETLVTQIAINLKPILSMRFDEKHTVEDLKQAVRDAVLRVPEKFKRIEKVREAHKKKAANEPAVQPAQPSDAPGVPDSPAR